MNHLEELDWDKVNIEMAKEKEKANNRKKLVAGDLATLEVANNLRIQDQKPEPVLQIGGGRPPPPGWVMTQYRPDQISTNIRVI